MSQLEPNTNAVKPPEKSGFKKFLKIAAIVFLIVVAAGLVLGYVFEDKIKQLVVGSINKQLKIEVSVNEIHFSFIRKFPMATLQFDNLLAKPSAPFSKKDTLLYAQKIFLMFDIMDVFRGDYNLKKVELNDAALNLLTNKKGERNFDIWKESASESNEAFKSEMEDVVLKNVLLNFDNQNTKQHYKVLANNVSLNGQFTTDQFKMNSSGNVFVYVIERSGTKYIQGKNATLDLHIDIDNLHHTYTFQPSGIKIEEMQLLVSGKISEDGDRNFIDLNLKSEKANIISLLSLLPNTVTENLNDYKVAGDLTFSSSIKGFSSSKEVPLISVEFSTGNSQLSPPSSSYALKEISFKAFYTSRKSVTERVGFLSLKNFRGLLEGNPIRANIEIKNFEKPFINLQVDGTFDLKKLADFYKPDTIDQIEGSVQLNAKFSGQTGTASTYVSSGSAQLKGITVTLKNSPTSFKNFEGLFALKDNEFNITSLTGLINSSDVRVNGVITNAIDYLMLPGKPLIIDASLASRKINLDEIIVDDNSSGATSGIRFNPLLDFNFQLSVDELTYKKFSSEKIRGNITLQNSELNTDALRFNTCNGSVSLQGSIAVSANDSLLISCDAVCNNISIARLFTETNNFGQQVVQDKHLSGTLTTQIGFASMWSKTLEANPKTIYAKCNVLIENGELINFAPLKALSKFVKGTNFDRVKFETLSNTFEIKNRNITFPQMDINSSALNLSISGTHSFDNIVDYKIKMQLSEITGKKLKDLNTEFGTIEEDGLGHPKLYLTMKGNLDKPKFAYDKKAVEANIKQNFKQEKQTVKAMLHKEFGWFKKDTTVVKEQPVKPKKAELQIDTDDEDQ